MADKRVTQQDVARRLGLHRSTVSLAYRNHPSIPRTTRELIVATAEEMGYRPDPMLTALASYRTRNRPADYTGTLAWLYSSRGGYDWRNSYTYRQYFEGAQEQARTHGYRLVVFDLNAKGMTPKRLAEIFMARNIQGILLCPQPTAQAEMSLAWENFSAVTFGYTLKTPNLHKVTATHFRSTSLVLQKLRQMGYRRIGFSLTTGTDLRTDHCYLSAFVTEEYLNGTGFAIPPLMGSWQDFQASAADWVRRHRIEVVLTISEQTVSILQGQGFRVPEELGVACYCLSSPQSEISGVYENSVKIGHAAVDELVGMIQRGEKGVPDEPRYVLVEGKWNPGRTLRPCRKPSA